MKKSKIFMIFGIAVLVIAIVGSTLAYYVWNASSDEETKIVTNVGAATVYFDGGSIIENASIRPVSDKSKGIVKTIGFKGSVSGISANLYLDIINIDTGLKDNTFKYAFYDGSTLIKEGSFTDEYLNSNTEVCTDNNTTHIVLLSNITVPTTIKNYTLYIWIDGTQDNPKEMMNKTFSFKLHANGTGGIIKEGKIPDITESVSNSFAYTLVNKYLTNVSQNNTTDVTNNEIVYKYDSKNNMMSDIAGNLRYYGANPNNYIYFNCDDYSNQTSSTCEVWRIIGVFEGKVKIMRNESIGNYSWDNKNTSTGAENDYGKNDWSTARLMKLLNPSKYYEVDSNDNGNGQSLYWNRKSGYCFAEENNATKTCDFTSTGIKNEITRNMISESMWYLRGWNSSSVYSDQIYEYERTTGSVYSTTRPTSWKGKIALAYPSDYGYAADFGKCQKQLSGYKDSTCTNNNWMKTIITNNGGSYGWLLTPYSVYSGVAWFVFGSGYVYYNGNNAYLVNGASPVLYLGSELEIKAGNGSNSAPYQLSA